MQLIDTGPEPFFEDVVNHMASICSTPIAFVALESGSRLWINRADQERGTETTSAGDLIDILGREPSVTGDFVWPLSILPGDEPVRSYIVAPLILHGSFVGLLGIADVKPRQWGKTEINYMTRSARLVAGHFEARTALAERDQALRDLCAYQNALNTHLIVAITDSSGDILFANDRFGAISGYDCEELVGTNHKLMNSGAHPPAFFVDMWRTIETGHAWRGDICYRAKGGARYWADTIIVPLAGEDGAPRRYISLSYDVTAHKKVEAVAERKQKIGQLIAAMQGELIASGAISVSLKQSLDALLPIVGADVALVLDVGRTQSGELWCNVACDCRANANQVAFAEEPVLINLRSQPPLIRECASAGLIFGGKTSQELGASTFKAIPIRSGAATIGMLAIGGERVVSEAFLEELEPFAAAVGDLMVAQREADQRRTAADEARLLARQDALTGLGNRRFLVEEFEGRVDHPDARFSLLLIDLDRFKPINDTHGHMIGDEVLKVISARLRSCVRRDCAVVRLGGDEFAILTEPRHDDCGVEELVARVMEQLPIPIETNGMTLSVGASVGVARYPGDANTADDLLQRADAAMYRAKERRGEAQFFNSSMDLRIRQKAALETALREAVANDQIVPYFQPLVRLDTGDVVGHEVLARWRHHELGFIPPTQFIPIAEEAGLIEAIFWSVLRTAARKYQGLNATTLLSVNLSPAQIKDPLLAQRLLQALAETGLPPQRLEIELTETAMLVDIERARALIISLKNQGIRIALDDFGTGYSSLVLLRDLPIDKLKIDRSFIGAIDVDTSASTVIVDAILGLAKAMSLAVTAEGIETETVANLLRNRGCQYGQGYLFGAATPAPVFEIEDLKLIGSQAA